MNSIARGGDGIYIDEAAFLRSLALIEKEFKTKLPRRVLANVLKKTVRQGSKLIVREAQKNTSVFKNPTGRLERAITVKHFPDFPNSVRSMPIVKAGRKRSSRSGAFYAVFPEYGTTRQPDRFFFKNAFETHEKTIVAAARRRLMAEVNKKFGRGL